MKKMRMRWSESNERYLPAVDVADIPRYEHENGLIDADDNDDE